MNKDCPDCGTSPGDYHCNGCDIERCPECGHQHLSCGCDTNEHTVWTGEWPGVAECREFGWYAKRNPSGPGWVSCSPDDVGATEDLNRLYAEAEWDKAQRRFVKKEGVNTKWRAGILDRPEVAETKYHAVFDERNRIIAATGVVGDKHEQESVEHTHLIAAAPEMLEALEALTEPCPPDYVVEWAKQIVKKAKGEDA